MALAAYMHFPFDSESANHYYQIMSKEMNRGPDAELSHIGKLISNDVKRRKRRAFLAGRVALEMIEQAIKSGQPSLQKAATIVSDIAYDTTVDGGKPLTSDPTDVKKCFRQFKDAAHLWAAQIEYEKEFQLAAANEHNLMKFLLIAIEIEEYLSNECSIRNWNPWRIPMSIKQ
jgi:hypothetical protein